MQHNNYMCCVFMYGYWFTKACCEFNQLVNRVQYWICANSNTVELIQNNLKIIINKFEVWRVKICCFAINLFYIEVYVLTKCNSLQNVLWLQSYKNQLHLQIEQI